MTDETLKKAIDLQERIKRCGNTFRVTAEDIMQKATPEEIDFFYDKLSAIERETLTNTIKDDRI